MCIREGALHQPDVALDRRVAVAGGRAAQGAVLCERECLLEDPRVTTLGIYIEAFDSVTAFEELARKSRALNKPVVVYKVGKSEQA